MENHQKKIKEKSLKTSLNMSLFIMDLDLLQMCNNSISFLYNSKEGCI